MAASGNHGGNAVTQDTLITVKISVNDSMKKLKLPLRDLGANLLIDKLRHCLGIKPEQHATFERFSDSAGGYITLDSTNPQVFKTLIRAAKAKLKLRLKATVSPDPAEKSTAPEASAVQDNNGMASQKTLEPVIVRSPVHQNSPRDSAAVDARSVGSGIFQFREARASQQTLVNDDAPVPKPFDAEASKDFFKGIAAAGQQRELAFRSREQPKSEQNEHPLECLSAIQPQWSVYCNNCDAAMLNAHYHCSICDGGDYDLCEKCISSGKLCPGEGHWLIKRSIQDGKVVASTTERIGRKFQKEVEKEMPGAYAEETKTLAQEPRTPTRTCNNCVYILPEHEFVTCTACEDFDLCISCLAKDKHGHHPAHAFEAVSEETTLGMAAEQKLAPGRMIRHSAICDGCDKNIFGIRHKCQDCPDWDYCSDCMKGARTSHRGHRFAAIYTPLSDGSPSLERHAGIYCDGPLCADRSYQTFITGARYKCAVCHDTDFCASCEASPALQHNRTHPLIKFKTPIRDVSITTMNEDTRGRVRNLGDRMPQAPVEQVNAATQVQTMAEIQPTEPKMDLPQPIPVVKTEERPFVPAPVETPHPSLLTAVFVHDSVPDGQVMQPGSRFTQIWTLKNDGPFAWPAGCSVRFIGGDNMLNVDNAHPASVAALADATESNVIGRAVGVGEEIAFKVTLKAPLREGKAISYWRVKAADGTPFGHRLWCDVEVKAAEEVKPMVTATPIEQPAVALPPHLLHQQQAILRTMQAQMAQREQMLRQLPTPSAPAPQVPAHCPQASTAYNNHPINDRIKHKMNAFRDFREANWHDNYQPAPQSIGGITTEAESARKEAARLRVEAIKAKILKARAEKGQRRAALAEKLAQEDEKVRRIVEEVGRAPVEAEAKEMQGSTMVFPTLERESPTGSFVQGKGKAAYVEDETEVAPASPVVAPAAVPESVASPPQFKQPELDEEEAFEDSSFSDDEELEVLSASGLDSEDEDGFLTDEEYDILDASDGETVASAK